ncbi:MAG: YdhR family protein [Dehalococcoidia bacterium]|nr:YdhR family protein [Dehalococcoidia bacterium]
MHITVVNFHLKEMTHEQFLAACDELAPAYAAIPGLIQKVWLSDPASTTYGGVYTWTDRAAFAAFAAGDLARAVVTHPNFADVTIREFEVLEAPTRVTRGLAVAGVR